MKLTKWHYKMLLKAVFDGLIDGILWSIVIYGSLLGILIIAGKIYCKVKGI